jgi:hypothetical protein
MTEDADAAAVTDEGTFEVSRSPLDPAPAYAVIAAQIDFHEKRLAALRELRDHVEEVLGVPRIEPVIGWAPGAGLGVSPATEFGKRLSELARGEGGGDPDALPDDVEETGFRDGAGPTGEGEPPPDGATVEEPGAEPGDEPANPPQEPAQEPPPASDPSPPARPTPAPASPRSERRARKQAARVERDEGAREGRKAESMERDERVLAFITEHPGATGTEVAEALSLRQSDVSQISIRLNRQQKISRRKEGRVKRLFPAGHEGAKPDEIAPSDEDGCKTRLERQILEAVRERPLTLGGLAVKLKMRQHVIAEVCAGMVRRKPPVLIRLHKIGEAQARFRPAGLR